MDDKFQNNIQDIIKYIAKSEGTEEQFALRDLLTDIRHVADKLNLDFNEAIMGSLEVYSIELAEAENQKEKNNG